MTGAPDGATTLPAPDGERPPALVVQGDGPAVDVARAQLAAEGLSAESEASPLGELVGEVSGVLVADVTAVLGLGAGLAAANGEVSVVAVGCQDSSAVDAALQAGAESAVRHDATARELAGIVRRLVRCRELASRAERLELDLEQQNSLVMKDHFTAAFNRRYFARYLDAEIERVRRFGGSVALIFMDIDDLKAVNVRHGHATGSSVLREVARRTIRAIRSIDQVVRYGGDEFCIVLPQAEAEGAREVAERVRQEISATKFELEGVEAFALTASFGIAAHPRHGATREELVRAADGAMFKIKAARKNGILIAGQDHP